MNVEDEGFEERNRKLINAMTADPELRQLARRWWTESAKYEYSYHFRWLGRPFIQHPQDIVALQEVIWDVKPDLIIETGVARGGGAIFYSSMLELLGGEGEVVGVDIDVREHNRQAIEAHPMSHRVTLIEGDSIDPDSVSRVQTIAERHDRIMIVLDSLHTHDHVLGELRAYAPLVSVGSYAVVLDTIIEDVDEDLWPDRPWGRGNNPKTAVESFLEEDDRFEVDHRFEDKLLITSAPGGYLKRIRE